MNKEKTTVENALMIFQNNLKGEYVVILEALNNEEPDANSICVEFKTAKKLLKFLAKYYGNMIVDFELYYKPINK